MQRTDENISNVFIMLGSKCNFHCRHCLQTGSNYLQEEQKLSDTLITYLKNLALRNKKKIVIQPWGGEPLLYWNQIVKIVNTFGDIFDYGIVSNGDLLNQEMVNFINLRNLSFTLSNDGKDTAKIRDKNVLEDENFCKLFAQIQRKSFCSVMHAYNQDPRELINYLKNKFNININWEFLVCSWDMPADIYNFNLNLVREAYQDMFKKAEEAVVNLKSSPELSELGRLINVTMRNLELIKQNKKIKLYPKCNPQNILDVDLNGVVYVCHNVSTPIGKVTDPFESIMQNFDKIVIPLENKKNCTGCIAFPFCRGGCPFSDPTISNGVAMSCEVQKIRYEECVKFINNCNKRLQEKAISAS